MKRISVGTIIFFSANVLLAQFVQQGPKLVGTGAIGSAYQGEPVALSADGNTALVAGTYDNGNVGAVWAFTRSGAVWTQQGSKLVGTGAVGNAVQGRSAALSADGNTAIVGGSWDNGNMGAAWAFTRSGGVWSQQGPKLVGTGGVGAAGQGTWVALSADGNTAIVGAESDNGNLGAAWVFTRSGGTWTQQGAKLVGSGAIGSARQGFSVALSADGNTAALGGKYDNGFAGAVWVFTRSGGVWTQQGAKLVGTGAAGNAYQGVAVALSSDGNTLLVGGPNDYPVPSCSNFCNLGAAWVFTRSGGVWSQQGPKLVGTGSPAGAAQGYSVALSGDGNTAVVGGVWDNAFAGAAWVFTRSGGAWSQLGSKLVGTGAVGNAQQGASVSISADASTVMVGGSFDNGNTGAAWVFFNAAAFQLVPTLGPLGLAVLALLTLAAAVVALRGVFR